MRSPILILSLLTFYSEAKDNVPEDDDTFVPSVDVANPPNEGKPIFVPFGHIFKDGVEDPFSDQKPPIDLLELHLKTPRTQAEAEKLLKETPKERILKVYRKNLELDDVDEDIRIAEELEKEKHRTKPPTTSEEPRWIDFAGIHNERLKDSRPTPTPVPLPSERPVIRYTPGPIPPSAPIVDENFRMMSHNPYNELKWTSCREFAKGSSSFHPKDIVDIDWTPFYIWSLRRFREAVVHRFSYPTKRLVREYKQLYGSILNATLDWEQPKLVLNESMEMLLIADSKDRRGLFHAVPRRPVPKDMEMLKQVLFAVAQLRVKIVDPYLALMYCDEHYATVMATPGNDPANDQERIEEASTINFKGIGYPVSINYEELLAAQKAIEEQKKAEEEMKYIKALNVDAIKVDMD